MCYDVEKTTLFRLKLIVGEFHVHFTSLFRLKLIIVWKKWAGLAKT